MVGSSSNNSPGTRRVHSWRVALAAVTAVLVAFFGIPAFAPLAGAQNPAADLDQCANGGVGDADLQCVTVDASGNWINGNLGASKAHYAEGESVPYRMRFTDLGLAAHTVTIEWDTTKSGKHALDYLTTYNRTETDAMPTSGVAGLDASVFSTWPIPADGTMTARPDWSSTATQVAGVFTLWGGTITGVSAYTYSGDWAGDSSARLTISFTASVANPVLAWGGHIASRQDWGEDNSAVAISGSPYHMRLIDLDGAGGNQDRSLSNEAVIFPGSITITKNAIPDSTTSFPFTSPGLTPATFNLVDDGTGPGVATQVFADLKTFTTYTITEGPVSTWTLSGISCIDPSNGTTWNTTTRVATIDLDEGENITCTFSNTKNGALSVTKTAAPTTVPEPGGLVTFTVVVTNPGGTSVTLGTLTDNIHGTLAGDADCKVGTVLAAGGSCSFTFQASVTGDAGDVETDTVTVTGTDSVGNALTASDDATVTITNVMPDIAVTKTASPTSVPETGGSVVFTFRVTNNTVGESVTISSLSDSDYGTLSGDADCAVGTVLAPAAYCEFSITRTVSGDYGGPDHNNVFTAKATDDDGNEDTASDDATVTFTDVKPEINVVKTASATEIKVGESVTYTYTVTNPGAEPLLKVAVTDDKCSPLSYTSGDSDGDNALDPGETWTFRCTTALTGTTVNTATASGEDDDGNKVTDTDTARVVVVNPKIAIDKVASAATASPGDRVTFTYTVTNPGDDRLTAVAVADDKCAPVTYQSGDADGDNALDPGEKWTYTCTAAMPDVDGPVTNIASVSGVDRFGGKVSADDTATVDVSPVQVLGVVVAKTGMSTARYLLVGLGLIVLGALLYATARRRRVVH